MGAGSSRNDEPPAHRSLNCRVATVVEFVNECPCSIQTIWVDYGGRRRRYFVLPLGGTVRQPTFCAHPWVFEALDGPDPEAVCVVDDQAFFYAPLAAPSDLPAPQARIRLARPLPWSPASHPRFPPWFRGQAAALLLCHARLGAGATAQRAAQARLEEELQAQGPLQGLVQRLRGLNSSCGSRRVSAAEECPPACSEDGEEMRGLLGPHLGWLPKDVLLLVLAAAAPVVPLVLKPPRPHDVEWGEVAEHSSVELFRDAAPGGGGDAAAGRR